MPGMMDTVLNLGPEPGHGAAGLIALTGNERFGYDAWRRFVAMFGRIVLDMPADGLRRAVRRRSSTRRGVKLDTDLTADELRAGRRRFATIVRSEDRGAVPDRSVSAARARHPGGVRLLVRQARPRLPRVQQDPPRPGHRGEHRDHGLRQHGRRLGHRRRLHARPEHRREGDLRRVPDQRAGRGRRGRRPHAREDQPDARRAARRSTREFEEIAERLEGHYRDVQDLEFTIERGKLYMLQTRSAKRTAPAAVKIAVDMVSEGDHHARRRRSSGSTRPRSCSSCCRASTRRRRPRSADRFLGKGLNASPGAAVGQGDLRPGSGGGGQGGRRPGDPGADRDLARTTCTACSPPRASSPPVAGPPRHAAVVARSMGLPCVAGAESLKIDYAKREMQAGTGHRPRGRHDQHRRHDRRDLRRASCRPSRRASRTSTTSPRSWAGPMRSVACRSGPTPTTRATRSAPAPSARRASACAGPSTCSSRRSGCRRCGA